MKSAVAGLATVSLAVACALHASDADACGGCFVPPSESTQVTGHRMVLSVSTASTTLWDQITYSGDPASFAWVLPIQGPVEIGLSSDALFNNLGALTAAIVVPPQYPCPRPPYCPDEDGSGGSGGGGDGFGSGASGGQGGGGRVQILAEAVVGPYETVQLASQDPQALQDWLTSHGYQVPADVAPVIDAYVAEGSAFLAMKLVPGQGIASMRPVRITSPGASPALPLRMVAAGTGVTTAVTLWIFGEGRYGPTSHPSFLIDEADLVWDWSSYQSNYALQKQAGFDASEGHAWLVEAAEPFSSLVLDSALLNVAELMPLQSGYGDAMGLGAVEECQADLDHLYGSIALQSLWVTRLHARLSRPALDTDLLVGASGDQSKVDRSLLPAKQINVPQCIDYPPCDATGSGASGNGESAGGDTPFWPWLTGGGGSTRNGVDQEGSCAFRGPASSAGPLAHLALFTALLALRRRSRTARRAFGWET